MKVLYQSIAWCLIQLTSNDINNTVINNGVLLNFRRKSISRNGSVIQESPAFVHVRPAVPTRSPLSFPFRLIALMQMI